MKVSGKPARFAPIKEIGGPRHRVAGLQPGTRAFRWGRLTIFVSRHYNPATEQFDGHWHLSIDGKTRYPTWDELVAARYALIPHDATMAMALPALGEYINLGEFVFQIKEVPRGWLSTSADRAAARPGDTPTALRDYRPVRVIWNGAPTTATYSAAPPAATCPVCHDAQVGGCAACNAAWVSAHAEFYE